MNKTEPIETLKRRLDDAERKLADQALELAVLRKALEAPEPVKKPLIWGDDDHYSTLTISTRVQHQSVGDAYADAINTLLDLRRQPGSEAAKRMTKQWLIDAGGTVQYVCNTEWKLQQLCPMFDSRESALAAMEAVGWDRIKRMMDTLHGRGYEVL